MSKKTKAEDSGETHTIWTKRSKADEKLGEYLVTFEMVDNPSDEEHRLAKDIVLLDHRSLRLLGPCSRE
jgi:hypothetical protein